MNQPLRRFWTTLTLLAAMIAIVPACTVNPATGQRQINALGEAQEIAMGAEAAPQFLAEYGGPVEATVVVERVEQLGTQMAAISERPDLPWEFFVVDSAVINAFALPGGKVFLSRGLIEKMDNEAMMAGVLGHEIGHVTAQHIGQQITRQMGVQMAAAVLTAAGEQTDQEWLSVLGLGAQAGGTVYLLKFGRDQELEADRLGMRYMTKIGYNPKGQRMLMEVLAAAGGGGQIELLSTHPHPSSRIEQIDQLLTTEYRDHDEPGRYQLNRELFHQTILASLKRLAPARHPKPEPQSPAGLGPEAPSDRALAWARNRGLGAAASWCGVCAQAEAEPAVALHPGPGRE